MNASVSLERILFNVPNNHDLVYPPLEENVFLSMDMEAFVNEERIICFPYLRHVEEKDYIDIYIYDYHLEEGCKRFVIEKGYALGEKEEELLLSYLHKDIWVENELYEHLLRSVKDKYPEIHLVDYKDFRNTLRHVYYSLFKSGPQEILFKANLNFLAAGLEGEYNLIGTTPEKILGVQLGMLRALNTPFGVELMADEENRKWARHLYSKYHNFIRGTTINKYQWRYLKEREEGQQTVDKKMYQFLGHIFLDRDYYLFLIYLEQKQVVDEYYANLPQYPDMGDLREHAVTCGKIEWYIECEWGIDRRLREKARKFKADYSFETSEYVVMIPSSLMELLQESQNQHNCLYDYVLRVALKNTIILFLREKGKENESYVTIEVVDKGIRQAFGRYNRNLDEKQKRYLEEYAKCKGLAIWSEADLDWDDEGDDWDEEEDED